MKYINYVLSKKEIGEIIRIYGKYIKITADINKDLLVVGCNLHADGERRLLQKGSNQDEIWGGGINMILKEIDTTAVLNIRPRLGNNSMEILDGEKREKFIKCVRKVFIKLWEK